MTDKKYMLMAIDLAKKGIGFTSPNPIVGAIIVKDNEIINTGYHEKCGGWHAERNAILNSTKDVKGSTLYVTLEPCCHYGKTPPCTEVIINSGISTVVIGSMDPNPLVAGKGVETLRNSGINVITDFMKEECDALNPIFFHYIKTKTPYVVMKYAMTADGKISTTNCLSKWITNEKSRHNVHKSRHMYSGIMVGINTVLSDNPLLNCRIDGGKNPTRIICDTNLRTPLDCNIIKTSSSIPTIIATTLNDLELHEKYKSYGCEILLVHKKDNHLDLKDLMAKLGALNIDSILLEGGSALNFSALSSKIVNKVQAYIAPKIFGGENAKSPVGGLGVMAVNDAFKLINPKISYFDDDIQIEWEVEY